jgi:hypothetical protein
LTSVTTWVSDETWAQLDPDAGRLHGRSRIVLAVATVAVVLVGSVAVAAGQAGLITPRINAELQEQRSAPGSHTVSEKFLLSTQHNVDETVTGVAAGGPGIGVQAVTRLPATIPRSGVLVLSLRVTVHDCGALGDHGLPVIIHFHRFWGTASTTIGQNKVGLQPGIAADAVQRICH